MGVCQHTWLMCLIIKYGASVGGGAFCVGIVSIRLHELNNKALLSVNVVYEEIFFTSLCSNLRSFRGGVVKNPCSPKALPLKKSAALSVIQRESPGSCHPLCPHASQNWVQHRLRELRSR